MNVVFINCDEVPYVDLIMLRMKLFETRSRRMLHSLLNQPVYIAETHHGKPPRVRCSLVFTDAFHADSREAWETVRPATCVPAGGKHDWQEGTRKKWLYEISDVRPCVPFTPSEGVRHGRVWMECET